MTINIFAEGNVMAAHLVMLGSCRGAADQARIDALKARVKVLGLQVAPSPCITLPSQ
jgi:hypothetical protein